jgi:hypothetical protein
MRRDDWESVWLVIFMCPCPHCAHPSVHYRVLGYEPTIKSLEPDLGRHECDRCHEKFRLLVSPEYEPQIIPWNRKKSFPPRT